MSGANRKRLFVKTTRENLPQVKDKYPFLYLERGRLEIDDSSVKWIDADGQVIRLPVATLSCLLLGNGTSVTHDAIKTLAAANCTICWVGQDSLLFYAVGQTPTANTKNLRKQVERAGNPKKRLAVAKNMFLKRFPETEVSTKSLKELMAMEAIRVRRLYEERALHYGVGWKGRRYVPGKFELSDISNRILTSCNAALYGVLSSVIHALGYSPHVGFVHSGSPLPFVYDIADLYKAETSIELAFALPQEMEGVYNRYVVAEAFMERLLEGDLLKRIPLDIERLFL